ncbi:hypothetical protein MHYP_G00030550 [Metynnis hypsauchen]
MSMRFIFHKNLRHEVQHGEAVQCCTGSGEKYYILQRSINTLGLYALVECKGWAFAGAGRTLQCAGRQFEVERSGAHQDEPWKRAFSVTNPHQHVLCLSQKPEIFRKTAEVEIVVISTDPCTNTLLLTAMMEELVIPAAVWSGDIDATVNALLLKVAVTMEGGVICVMERPLRRGGVVFFCSACSLAFT